MAKPYWNGPEGSYDTSGARRFAGRYAGGGDGAPASGPGPSESHHGDGRTATDTYDAPTHRFEREDYDDPRDYEDGDYADYDEDYDDYPPDNRWRWIAGLAGAILLIAVIAIAFAMRGGGDTASTSATPTDTAAAGTSAAQDAISTTPRTVIATIPPSTPAAATPLPPETIVTVTTTPSAHTTAPDPAAPAGPAPAEAAPPAPERTITYTVTGTRSLFDLVTIIYSDEQGFPRTDINVALPWTRTVVLNPGVETKSLTATSLTGQLNCAVTDGTGAVLKQQTPNTAVAAC